MTEVEEEVLKELLNGHVLVYPCMVYGMLGGDPNHFGIMDDVRICQWLEHLGYRRESCRYFRHAHMLSCWVRDEYWPGEKPEERKPYSGIPLVEDPELRPTPEERAERREARRNYNRYLHRLR